MRSGAVECGFPRSREVECGRVRSCAVPCGRVRSSAVVRDRVRSCAISCGREQILLILRYNLLRPGIISNRSQNARSMAHSLLTHSVCGPVFTVCGGRALSANKVVREIGPHGCMSPPIFRAYERTSVFAHLTPLCKNFAMLTSFRAFAPNTAEFRLLPTHGT